MPGERVRARSIVLGDQSPWAGGLMRWYALSQLPSQVGEAPEVRYCVQDIDVPWALAGCARPRLNKGWSPHWSLACRYSWALSVPGAELPGVMQSLRSPPGLRFVSGPPTRETLGSPRCDAMVASLVREMLDEQIAWSERLAELLGVAPRVQLRLPPGGVREIVVYLAERLGLGQPRSFSSDFSSDGPALAHAFGPRHYWYLDDEGRRYEQPAAGRRAVPRGKLLPLELAARGAAVAFTGLPYLDEVLALRDRFAPDLEVELVRVSFDWELGDALAAQLELFNRRKRERGQPGLDADPEILAAIERYWRLRPTAIPWLILGGALNPTVEVTRR